MSVCRAMDCQEKNMGKGRRETALLKINMIQRGE